MGEWASSFSEGLSQAVKNRHKLHVCRNAHSKLKDAMVQGSLCGNSEQLKMVSAPSSMGQFQAPFLRWSSQYGLKMAPPGKRLPLILWGAECV